MKHNSLHSSDQLRTDVPSSKDTVVSRFSDTVTSILSGTRLPRVLKDTLTTICLSTIFSSSVLADDSTKDMTDSALMEFLQEEDVNQVDSLIGYQEETANQKNIWLSIAALAALGTIGGGAYQIGARFSKKNEGTKMAPLSDRLLSLQSSTVDILTQEGISMSHFMHKKVENFVASIDNVLRTKQDNWEIQYSEADFVNGSISFLEGIMHADREYNTNTTSDSGISPKMFRYLQEECLSKKSLKHNFPVAYRQEISGNDTDNKDQKDMQKPSHGIMVEIVYLYLESRGCSLKTTQKLTPEMWNYTDIVKKSETFSIGAVAKQDKPNSIHDDKKSEEPKIDSGVHQSDTIESEDDQVPTLSPCKGNNRFEKKNGREADRYVAPTSPLSIPLDYLSEPIIPKSISLPTSAPSSEPNFSSLSSSVKEGLSEEQKEDLLIKIQDHHLDDILLFRIQNLRNATRKSDENPTDIYDNLDKVEELLRTLVEQKEDENQAGIGDFESLCQDLGKKILEEGKALKEEAVTLGDKMCKMDGDKVNYWNYILKQIIGEESYSLTNTLSYPTIDISRYIVHKLSSTDTSLTKDQLKHTFRRLTIDKVYFDKNIKSHFTNDKGLPMLRGERFNICTKDLFSVLASMLEEKIIPIDSGSQEHLPLQREM